MKDYAQRDDRHVLFNPWRVLELPAQFPSGLDMRGPWRKELDKAKLPHRTERNWEDISINERKR